ncbi:MAG: HEAT repeat domain-containing protein [Polyangiaceae bacterium]|nr:HEAT repeat domain-containing protein [Polyangiaceae bacterium]
MVEMAEGELSEYLSRLHAATTSVHLLGDSNERWLTNVFVDMDVSVSDERRTPILRDLLKRPLEKDKVERDSADAAEAELQLELLARSERLDGSLVTASRTLELGPRILLTGVAGAGKTTLLRWLAGEVARSAELLPVWIPHLHPLGEDLPNDLVQLACSALELVPSPDFQAALASAIREGRAQVLIDGLDEAPEEVGRTLLGRLAAIGPSVRVIVATRPLGETPVLMSGFLRARLLGLRAGGMEAFLTRYFGDAAWTHDLVRDLSFWPSAEPWQKNPALLSLAASLYASGKRLTGSTIELYEAAIDTIIRDAENAGKVKDGNATRAELVNLAMGMFAPESGSPRALLKRDEVSAEAQHTGLLRGGAWLRFTHLSLGEYLAATGPIPLRALRAKYKVSPYPALETLPMAHGLRGDEALEEALADADAGDADDHRMLALVLRAVTFAGERARSFSKKHAAGLIKRIADRMSLPSGRFGPSEESLTEHAERALLVMARDLGPGDGAPLAALSKSLGNVGAEAKVLLWTAGLGEPVRTSAHGKVARRVGAALVRARMDVSWIVAHTGGEAVFFVRAAAVTALANDPDAKPLIRERLTDDDANVRAAAVQALVSDPESVPLIRERLADEDVDVKAAAITALSGDPDSRPLIRERLKDNEPTDNNVRSAAILALANDPESYPLLRERLSDRSGTVRVAAFQALAKDPESWPLLRAKTSDMDYNVRAAAYQALANDPTSLPMLRERLTHESYAVRSAAVAALAADSESVHLLRERLKDESWAVRAAAAAALATDTASWQLIHPLLSDSDKDVRAVAVEALAKDDSARSVIRELLNDKAARVRAAAATALGEGGALPEDRSSLRDHLTPTDPNVRAAAFHALATDRNARTFLRERLDDDDLGVKAVVFDALSADPEARPLLRARLNDALANARAAATRALASDPESRPLLRERLNDPDPNVRTEAVRALASDLESRALLRLRAADMAPAVRAAVAYALSTDPLSRSILRERLDDEDNDVRTAAVTALGSDPEAKPLIRRRLEDSAPTVRAAAIRSLTGDPESRAALCRMLEDRAGTVRVAAVYAVMDDPEARPLLRDRLEDDDDLGPSGRRTGEVIRATAVTALATDPDSQPLLVDRLADPAPTVRAAAVYALARDPNARPLVRSALVDKASGVRAAACHALETTRAPRDGVALSQLEKNELWAPAFRAARASFDPDKFEKDSVEAAVCAFTRSTSPAVYPSPLGEALRALLLVRLGWAAEGGTLRPDGKVLGELPMLPTQLVGNNAWVIRLRMNAEDLPKERLLHPLHNLMEAWQLGSRLRSPGGGSFWLACADVDFDDVVLPSLNAGQVFWGPTYWGFALPG